MSSKEFRFAVGEPSGERSTVWKIWAQKSDVYIQSRMLGSDSKVSLHGSGQCQWSMTSEWVLRQTGARNADRHIVRWTLPEVSQGNAAHVFRIIIPNSELRQIIVDEKLKKVVWLPAPKQGYATQIECYFTPRLDGPPNTSSSPYQHLVSILLEAGRWFVVFVQEAMVTEDNLQILEGARTQIISKAEQKGIILQPQYRVSAFLDNGVGCKGFNRNGTVSFSRG